MERYCASCGRIREVTGSLCRECREQMYPHGREARERDAHEKEELLGLFRERRLKVSDA